MPLKVTHCCLNTTNFRQSADLSMTLVQSCRTWEPWFTEVLMYILLNRLDFVAILFLKWLLVVLKRWQKGMWNNDKALHLYELRTRMKTLTKAKLKKTKTKKCPKPSDLNLSKCRVVSAPNIFKQNSQDFSTKKVFRRQEVRSKQLTKWTHDKQHRFHQVLFKNTFNSLGLWRSLRCQIWCSTGLRK